LDFVNHVCRANICNRKAKVKGKLVILGAGESGLGAALLAAKNGYEVFVSDYGIIEPLFKDELVSNDIAFEEEQHTDSIILSADLIIKSPGIPEKAAVIKKIREQNISLISEIEFAYRLMDPSSKTIAITGSNGKTTTTTLVYNLFKDANEDVVVCGNIGVSFARAVAERRADYYVIEISSFQLDDCYDFRPDVAVLTNVTPDHLDRYNNDFDQYTQSKSAGYRSLHFLF